MRNDLKEKAAIKEAAIKVILLCSFVSLLSWFDTGIVQIRMDENRYGAFTPQNHDITVSNCCRSAISFSLDNQCNKHEQ
jgi:hypothetical protein